MFPFHSSISKPSSSHDSVFSAEITQLIDEHLAQQLAGLIVFNSYKEIYTMEKFIVSLANSYQLKIWVADNCRHLMAALELENSDVTRLLTRKRHEAAIHILADEYLEVDVSVSLRITSTDQQWIPNFTIFAEIARVYGQDGRSNPSYASLSHLFGRCNSGVTDSSGPRPISTEILQ